MKKIYLDNAATTKTRQEVIDTMVDTMHNLYANADSTHDFGMEASKVIKQEKKIFETLLGLKKENVYFTAGGGDSNNILITSVVGANKKGHILLTPIEHPSVLETVKSLEDIYEVEYLKVDEYGFVDKSYLEEAVKEDTILVTIGFVNSEFGTIQDIKVLSDIVKRKNKNTVFHTDFVQGLGHVKVNFKDFPNVDAISMSSHKIYGPKGIGALYVNSNIRFKSTVHGSNTENLLVPRTMPNELVRGFLKAISLVDYNELNEISKVKKYATEKLIELGAKINTPTESSPAILNVAFKNARGEIILNYLSSLGIYISTGSACSAKKGVSNVVKNLVDNEFQDGVIRISFGRDNTLEEVDELVKNIKEVLRMMR